MQTMSLDSYDQVHGLLILLNALDVINLEVTFNYQSHYGAALPDGAHPISISVEV